LVGTGTSTSTTNRSSRSVAQHGERLCFCVNVSRQAMPSAMMKGKRWQLLRALLLRSSRFKE
jgi:hypothetical protein